MPRRISLLLLVAALALLATPRAYADRDRKGPKVPRGAEEIDLDDVDALTYSAIMSRRDPGGLRAKETRRQEALFREALIASGRGNAGVKARKRAERQARREARQLARQPRERQVRSPRYSPGRVRVAPAY